MSKVIKFPEKTPKRCAVCEAPCGDENLCYGCSAYICPKCCTDNEPRAKVHSVHLHFKANGLLRAKKVGKR